MKANRALPTPGAVLFYQDFVAASDPKLAVFAQEIGDVLVLEYVSEKTGWCAIGIEMMSGFSGQ